MKKVQIIESERFEKYADFENCDVWLLSRENDNYKLNPKVRVVEEVAYSYLPYTERVPKLMTELYKNYPDEKETIIREENVLDEKGRLMFNEDGTHKTKEVKTTIMSSGFSYEIITDDMSNYEIRTLICDSTKIKVIR